jgi:hypothetical protein
VEEENSQRGHELMLNIAEAWSFCLNRYGVPLGWWPLSDEGCLPKEKGQVWGVFREQYRLPWSMGMYWRLPEAEQVYKPLEGKLATSLVEGVRLWDLALSLAFQEVWLTVWVVLASNLSRLGLGCPIIVSRKNSSMWGLPRDMVRWQTGPQG